MHVIDKSYYAGSDGGWVEVTVEEMRKLLALIIYMGIVNVPELHKYWSTDTLYHGLWARRFLARDR